VKKKIDCILLIDDNADDNTYNQIIIEKMDVAENIKVAENGQEALKLLSEKDRQLPELILLDLNMPRMNGWEFLEAYKALHPEQTSTAKVVLLTTSLTPDDLRKLESIPWISSRNLKPLTPQMLYEIMNHYLNNGLASQEEDGR
jgi:CheY-like chemotaxis protein